MKDLAAEAADEIQDEVGRSSPDFSKVEAIIQSAIEKATADLEDKLQKERIEAGVIFERLFSRAAHASGPTLNDGLRDMMRRDHATEE